MNEKIKALRKELAALGLSEIFNPKYSPAFKKAAEEGTEAEETKLKELGAEIPKNEDANNEPVADAEETTAEEASTETIVENEKETEEEAQEEETETVQDETEETKAEETTEEIQSIEPEVKVNESQELLDTKLELELVKAKVRDDRVEDVKDFLKTKVKSIADVTLIPQILARYPEWVAANEKDPVKPFGMPIGDRGFGLTAEERRLKELGAEIGK